MFRRDLVTLSWRKAASRWAASLLLGLVVFAMASAASARAEPPARVVSMNLCADQLAMLLAAPGQLLSVSDWSARERASMMTAEARKLPLNGGLAEEVFTFAPDLVLAGSFTNRASVDMLRRLGLRVEVLPPARSLSEVRTLIAEVGALLGRETEAAALVEQFDASLADARAAAAPLPSLSSAYYYPNSYTTGAGTLADDIMRAAGLDNAAAALGLRGSVKIPLEVLVMQRPFLIETRYISGGEHGRSYETLTHPALRALRAQRQGAQVEERWQICGTPFVLQAIDALIAARR